MQNCELIIYDNGGRLMVIGYFCDVGDLKYINV